MHHPFTSPKDEDVHLMENELGKVRANAYDLVLNGVEVRLHYLFRTCMLLQQQALFQTGA